MNDFDLWRHVFDSAHWADGHLLLHTHGQAKVPQLHLPISANEYVLQLDIPAPLYIINVNLAFCLSLFLLLPLHWKSDY